MDLIIAFAFSNTMRSNKHFNDQFGSELMLEIHDFLSKSQRRRKAKELEAAQPSVGSFSFDFRRRKTSWLINATVHLITNFWRTHDFECEAGN